MTGKNLGHYALESRLGAGGFGEVYRARDMRLGRNVAVKLLPEVLAENPERVERFEREARVLASINHPNIAALYGLEGFENVRFLVMELAEGETLAERIARGPIPAGQALAIGVQIAEALEAAHEKGIVHRDLKPGNVKVTAEGKVKVLDFGLAKAMRAATPDDAITAPPTRSMSGTFAGVIQGTPAYMSPEQAKGFEGDARSDIFSFGCVLYEMLTGRQPFQGDTVTEMLAGVIARPADLSVLPPNLNPRIRELLRRSLEKDPRRRWQAVASVRVEIETVLADPRGVAFQAQTMASRPLCRRAVPVAAGILAGGIIAVFAAWSLKPPPARAVTRFTFSVPGFSAAGRRVLDITPDGTQFVYGSGNVLQLRPMNELDSFPIPIQNVPTIVNPSFSPDGKSIVFWTPADGTLKRVPLSGGAAVTLCPAENVFGMSWEDNDWIVFGQGNKGILRVSASGGKPDVLVTAQGAEFLHGPQVLPGRKAVLFTALAGAIGAGQWDEAKIYVQPLPSGERKLLFEGGTDARYLPTGHLVYFLGGNLLVVPFNMKTLTVTARAVPVVEGVRFAINGVTGSAQFTVSDTGTLLYVPAPPSVAVSAPSTTVTVLDSSGGGMPLPLPVNPYVSVRVSPDGKQLALGTDDGKEANIWVYDLSGKTTLRRLTLSGRNLYPIWSGDSKRVLFQSDREKDLAIYWQLADGTGTAERLTKPEAGDGHLPESWLPGQEKFSYWDAKSQDVWIHSIEDKKGVPLIVVPDSNQYDSTFSPDGHWIAYRSREAGKQGIYVEPYPQTGARYLLGVNEANAWAPAWSPDSKSVFFHRTAAGQLHAFNLQIQPFQLVNTVDLSVTQFRYAQNYRMYDVLPDGKHFVVIRSAQQGATTGTTPTPPPEIKVVLNWFEELKRLAPKP